MEQATAKIETVQPEIYIFVKRFYSNQFGTLGVLEKDGQRLAFTCEPPAHKSVEHECERLGTGYYGTEIDAVGNLPRIYAGRHGQENHPGMLGLTGTEPRSEICFHCGNEPKHSRGCILIGKTCAIDKDGRMSVGQSREAYKALYPLFMALGKMGNCIVGIMETEAMYQDDLRWRNIAENAAL